MGKKKGKSSERGLVCPLRNRVDQRGGVGGVIAGKGC